MHVSTLLILLPNERTFGHAGQTMITEVDARVDHGNRIGNQVKRICREDPTKFAQDT